MVQRKYFINGFGRDPMGLTSLQESVKYNRSVCILQTI